MEELEEDAEMRSRVALYKAPAAAAAAADAAAGAAVPAPRGMESDEEDSEGELPQVRGVVVVMIAGVLALCIVWVLQQERGLLLCVVCCVLCVVCDIGECAREGLLHWGSWALCNSVLGAFICVWCRAAALCTFCLLARVTTSA
jgi:hypothetical protein